MQPNKHRHAPPGMKRLGARQDPPWVRVLLTSLAVAVVGVLVVVPVVNVFYQALKPGLSVYWRNLTADPETRHAIMLTLIVAPTAVVANAATRPGSVS